jgi:Histone acetyl transferase HAT1 N-terminus
MSDAAAAPAAPKRLPEEAEPQAPPKMPKLDRNEYSVSANEALSFRLVRTAAEIDGAPQFNPEFTHQVFREDETIWGYRELEARGAARGAALTLQTRSPC